MATLLSLAILASLSTPITATPKMAAIGLPVSSIPKATTFYERTLGFLPTPLRINTTQFDELILQLPGLGTNPSLALMKWHQTLTPGVNTGAGGGKVVFYVDDVRLTTEVMGKAGGKVVVAPGTGKIGGKMVATAFVRDLDGNLIELNPSSLLGTGAAILGKGVGLPKGNL